jgi:IS5 family transposase
MSVSESSGREITRKMAATTLAEDVNSKLTTLLQRAERIRTQKTKDKSKLYAMHAPEVECIGKGKARRPYEFGVKASIAVTNGKGLVVGVRTFPGNPYDGHTLAAQIEQTTTLLEGIGTKPATAVVDLGCRGVDHQVPGIEVIHRGKAKRLTAQQKGMTEEAPGRRARDRGRQGRLPDGPMLAEGRRR